MASRGSNPAPPRAALEWPEAGGHCQAAKRSRPRRPVVKVMVLCLFLVLVGLGQPDVSGAYDNRRGFVFHGYVQWIAGSKLMLRDDYGAPVAIDLTEIDQSSY